MYLIKKIPNFALIFSPSFFEFSLAPAPAWHVVQFFILAFCHIDISSIFCLVTFRRYVILSKKENKRREKADRKREKRERQEGKRLLTVCNGGK